MGHQNADTAGYRTRVERTFLSAAVAVVLGVPTRLCASKRARVAMPSGKTSVHLRIDSDVFEWFKKQAEGHLTRMNAVLRAYIDAQKR
ncbi:MAG: BrnA antitoxin family protein [Terriglobales bacterium]